MQISIQHEHYFFLFQDNIGVDYSRRCFSLLLWYLMPVTITSFALEGAKKNLTSIPASMGLFLAERATRDNDDNTANMTELCLSP